MLTTAKKYGLLTLIALVIAWLLYVAVESTSFQICIADKEDKQPKESAEKNSLEVLGSLVWSARVKTDCIFVVLDENRDAITAIATAFIAIFTFTLWRSSDKLFIVTKESADAATMSAKAAKKSAEVAEKSLVIATRPRFTIPPPELHETQHISFSIANRGGVAIIDRVDASVQATRGCGGFTVTRPDKLFPLTINREIEAGQSLGEYSIALDWIGAPNLHREIKSGEATLKIIFQIISKDMFGKNYPTPTIPFDFDRGKWVFEPSRLLQPEKEQ